MNALSPNCIDEFLFSNAADQQKLQLILQRRLPFPFAGKSGILLHGTWGTGKSTLAQLLPGLLETAYSGTWNLSQGVGQMPSPEPDHCQTKVFRCGGGLSITEIIQTIMNYNKRMPLWHNSQHDYFVFDELDKLTQGAQQSLRATMDLKRCMYLMTTNYLNKIDKGIVNRCHLVEMNQITTASAYLPIGHSILSKMGLGAGAVTNSALLAMAAQARGSLRDFCNDVAIQGVMAGGAVP